MHTTLLLVLLSRGPLPIPDSAWSKPAEVRAAEQQQALERVHAEQQPQPETVAQAAPPVSVPRALEDRRIGLSLGVGALIGWPSLEVEVLPVQHVAGYVAGEASLLAPGFGLQAGLRLRPMKGLVGPWLDLHVRHSRFRGLTFSLEEQLSPGAAAGFSIQSRGGFLFSAGLGASFLVQTKQTRWGVGVAEAGSLMIPFVTADTSSQFGVQPELKLQVGWAI